MEEENWTTSDPKRSQPPRVPQLGEIKNRSRSGLHRNFVILGLALAFVGFVVLLIGVTNGFCPPCPFGATTCGCHSPTNYSELYLGLAILALGTAISLVSVFIKTKPFPSRAEKELAKAYNLKLGLYPLQKGLSGLFCATRLVLFCWCIHRRNWWTVETVLSILVGDFHVFPWVINFG